MGRLRKLLALLSHRHVAVFYVVNPLDRQLTAEVWEEIGGRLANHFEDLLEKAEGGIIQEDLDTDRLENAFFARYGRWPHPGEAGEEEVNA